MATLTAGDFPVRMDQLNTRDLIDGVVTSETSTRWAIVSKSGYTNTFNGVGLMYNGDIPTAGTITSFTLVRDGGTVLSVTNANVSAPDLYYAASHTIIGDVYNVVFGGDDTFVGGVRDDYLDVRGGNNYASGGLGADTIVAGLGNNHIWGNTSTAAQTDPDGNDTITVNGGTNYINGGGGDDRIEVAAAKVDGDNGVNRVYGGSGGDLIIVHEYGANHVNGNMGNDTIDASDSYGNNVLRGGQGDDVIRAGSGDSQLMGDIGNDTLVSSRATGTVTILTGGVGADTFDFSGAVPATVTVAGREYQTTVTDFEPGVDHIALAFRLGEGDLLTSSMTFSDTGAAQTYAQMMLTGHAGTTDVAALQVGSDTVIFSNNNGLSSEITSVVRLQAVNAGQLTTSDFTLAGG